MNLRTHLCRRWDWTEGQPRTRSELGGYAVCSRILAGALTAACLLAATPCQVAAEVQAYWRHEDGPSGQIVPDGSNTVLDSSGKGNHMQTFSSEFAPFTAATYTPNVSPLALRSGLENNLALDFGPNPAVGIEDGGGRNDDNYTQGKDLHTHLFTAMTVEVAFNMNVVDDSFQNIIGKDGQPLEGDSPLAPLQIKVRGDDLDGIVNQLQVEFIDGDGDIHSLESGYSVTAGEWMHVAFTLSATDAELWIAGETGDYLLADAISAEDFAGSLGPGEVTIFEPLGFTIGRGMFENNVTDWSDAIIDEARISDTVLTSDAFLFVPAPDEGLDGDYNGDSTVDAADYTLWRDTLNSTSDLRADGNGNSVIDQADYGVWRDHYGETESPTALVVQAPAPGSATLLSIFLLGAARRAERRNA